MPTKKRKPKGGRKARSAVQKCQRKATLVVNIVDRQTRRPVPSAKDITVTASGLASQGTKSSQTIFWEVPFGDYTVNLDPLPDSVLDAGYYLPTGDDQVEEEIGVVSEMEVVTLKLPSTWVVVRVEDDAGKKLDDITVKLKLPSDKTDEKPTKQGVARFERFRKGPITIEELTAADAVWEFVAVETV